MSADAHPTVTVPVAGLGPDDAAVYLGGVVSAKTLANWRCAGEGPAYCRVGGRVLYRLADLDDWLMRQRVA